jgi:hypothetical protein
MPFPRGAFLLVAVLTVSAPVLAQKTDLIFLHNGDRVTGEIKELQRGELRVTTNAFGTLYVNWEDVERIASDKRIQVEMVDGARYYGPASASEEPDVVSLNIAGAAVNLDLNQIVHLIPIKENRTFSGNLDNSLSIGFTYSRASDVLQWNVNASSKYRAEKYLASLTFDSMVTNNGAGIDSERSDLTASYSRFRGKRWFLFGTGSYQTNDELGISGRFLASGGVGRYLAQSTRHEFIFGGGLAGNWENATDSQPTDSRFESNAEGLLRVEYSYFKLNTPKSSINLALDYFAGITDTSRQRGDFNIRYRQEFVLDLFWNLTYYFSFDTKPPAGAFSESDHGVVTSIEYLF